MFLTHVTAPLRQHTARAASRIGRLDRLSRIDSDLPSLVLLRDSHDFDFDEHWFKLLEQGFGVFTEPISDLHLYVERKLPMLLDLPIGELRRRPRRCGTSDGPRRAGNPTEDNIDTINGIVNQGLATG